MANIDYRNRSARIFQFFIIKIYAPVKAKIEEQLAFLKEIEKNYIKIWIKKYFGQKT